MYSGRHSEYQSKVRILKFATADKTTCMGYVEHNISSPVKSVQVMATVVANMLKVRS